MNTNRIFEKIKNHKTAYILSIKSENLDAIEYASKLDYDAVHLDCLLYTSPSPRDRG